MNESFIMKPFTLKMALKMGLILKNLSKFSYKLQSYCTITKVYYDFDIFNYLNQFKKRFQEKVPLLSDQHSILNITLKNLFKNLKNSWLYGVQCNVYL